jgi:hypothetical protein
MRESIERAQEDFDDFVSKWDAAMEKGIFASPPSPPSTSRDTADHSFFGLRQDNHTDSIDDVDAKYWAAINSVADGGVQMERLDEVSEPLDPPANHDPNPIRRDTGGKDQDMEPRQLGVTFSEEEIEELDKMKKKLHELESKVASMDGKDRSSEVAALLKRIDDLSDKLGRTNR